LLHAHVAIFTALFISAESAGYSLKEWLAYSCTLMSFDPVLFMGIKWGQQGMWLPKI